MKQKYTVTVADMEMNIVSDVPAEELERLVGIIDRKIREIYSHSNRCPRNEAAILCALELCAEKIDMQKDLQDAENAAEEWKNKYTVLSEQFEKLSDISKRMSEENKNLLNENDILRSIAGKPIEAHRLTEPEETDLTPAVAEQPKAEATTEAAPESKTKNKKSRVGSMFDLLTFTDV